MEEKEKIKEYELDDFRKEIEGIAKKESEEGKTADFGGKEINPEELTEDDRQIWLKVKNDIVTGEDFEEYRKRYEETRGFESPARYGFLSLSGNKANGIIGRRWLEEEKKE